MPPLAGCGWGRQGEAAAVDTALQCTENGRMTANEATKTRVRGALGRGTLVLAAAWGAAPAASADVVSDEVLSPVIVTATRVAERSFDMPVAVDRVDAPLIHDGQLQVNLSESLLSVPGASVQSRQNYAQDLQISVRGFGARSSFGVSGVRLYADGIPGTMPDGQGQFSQIDLGSVDHIEVLRGPFSALYGNSSGGVIAAFTEDGPPGNSVEGAVDAGTFATRRYALKVDGDNDGINYVLDAAHFETGGYRDHSSAERDNFNAKLRFALSDEVRLTTVFNVVQTPFVQDPLGLTRMQLDTDRTQAGTGAVQYDTRKSLGQEQMGGILERRLSDTDDLVATVYAGNRQTVQFQAIPAFTERSPLSPGGVIGLDRDFWGADLHMVDHRDIAGTPLQVTLGASYDDLEERRHSFLNFAGDADGVQGALRVAEDNHVYDADEYLQAQWDPAARWRLLAGVRNSVVDVSSRDELQAADGAAGSGVRYAAVDPVAGVTYRASANANLYAAYGRGFETPTLTDLQYRSTDGSVPGLNLGLRPARSDNLELGLKSGLAWIRADLDAFYIHTSDELAVLANAYGRSVYHNISETQRRGAELSVDADGPAGLSARLAYTYLRAVTEQAYATCVGSPCLPATVAAGSYLPAVPMNALYAGLTCMRHRRASP